MGTSLPISSRIVFKPRRQPALGRAIQDRLGRHLRAVYEEIGTSPAPVKVLVTV